MTNLAQLLSGYENSHQYSCTVTDATCKTSSIISLDQLQNKHCHLVPISAKITLNHTHCIAIMLTFSRLNTVIRM